MNQAVVSILGIAVQLPALKKLGEYLRISMEDGIASVIDRPALSAKTADANLPNAQPHAMGAKPESGKKP